MPNPTPPMRQDHSAALYTSWTWQRPKAALAALPPAPPVAPPPHPAPPIAMSLIRRQPDGTLCWVDVPAPVKGPSP